MGTASRLAASAAALLLICACSAAGRELQATNAPEAPSLYECVAKQGLTDLQALIDAAGLKDMLSDPKLKMTLVAPDADAFKALFTDCKKPANVKPLNKSKWCSLEALLKDKKVVGELARYHLLPGLFEAKKGAKWFPASNKFWKQETVDGMIVRMRLWDNGYEIHGTGRDGYIVGSQKSGKAGSGGNHACGAGLMHVVTGVLTKNAAGL